MQAVARSVWPVAAIKYFKLTCSHIPGVDNGKADILSRVFEGNLSDLKQFEECIWWPVQGHYCYPNIFV